MTGFLVLNSIGKVDGESFRSLSQSQGRRKHLANAFLEEALHSVENYPKVCCVRSCAFRSRRNGAVVSTSCCRSVEFFFVWFGCSCVYFLFFFANRCKFFVCSFYQKNNCPLLFLLGSQFLKCPLLGGDEEA